MMLKDYDTNEDVLILSPTETYGAVMLIAISGIANLITIGIFQVQAQFSKVICQIHKVLHNFGIVSAEELMVMGYNDAI